MSEPSKAAKKYAERVGECFTNEHGLGDAVKKHITEAYDAASRELMERLERVCEETWTDARHGEGFGGPAEAVKQVLARMREEGS
jgi:hypothetical protein